MLISLLIFKEPAQYSLMLLSPYNDLIDIAAVKKSLNIVILFELSVIDDTHYRKVERYAKLISHIENNGYEVMYYPV